MIPATLHFVWLASDKADTPSLFHLACRDRARQMHIDWNYRAWTDDRLIREIPSDFGEVIRSAWNRFGVHARSDLFRLCVLYAFGGVYLDWDVWCVNPLDDFLIANDELILGWNSYEPPVVGEHVIGAAAGSPFIREAIEYLCAQKPDADGKYSAHLARLVLRDGIEAYPTNVFCPHGRSAAADEIYRVTSDTATIHCYATGHAYDVARLKTLTERTLVR